MAGTLAAMISLFRRIGVKRKAAGEVLAADYLAGVKVNAITLQLQDRLPGHEPGQFAFVLK